jgi:hypothetical protein
MICYVTIGYNGIKIRRESCLDYLQRKIKNLNQIMLITIHVTHVGIIVQNVKHLFVMRVILKVVYALHVEVRQ